MRHILFLVVLICSWSLFAAAEDYPKAEISNGLIHMELMLPDAEHGSYRGTRFDWAGIISSLKFQGHEYFGQWYERHDPKIHDAITGPVEEFLTNDATVGYHETPVGGTFVRIGIGSVRKPDEPAYRRFDTYDIVDPGKRTLRKGKDWIQFVHEMKSDQGYAFRYTKTLRLTKGKPQLVIEHALKNTGSREIDTFQYNHNFFVIDHEVVGPDMRIGFTFPPKALAELKNGAEIHGQEITYQREIKKGGGEFSELTGFSDDVRDYDIRIENTKSGAGVRIRGDRPLAKVMFWCINTVAVAEPYVHLDVKPGQETRWALRYDFYTLH